jgi:hypothetical protein
MPVAVGATISPCGSSSSISSLHAQLGVPAPGFGEKPAADDRLDCFRRDLAAMSRTARSYATVGPTNEITSTSTCPPGRVTRAGSATAAGARSRTYEAGPSKQTVAPSANAESPVAFIALTSRAAGCL